MKKKIERILENYFNIYENNYSDGLFYELESWTNGGVNMFITLDSNKDIVKEFKKYIDYFDIDEEIEIHRENKEYKNNFTIRESLEDFENWLQHCKNIYIELKGDHDV